MKQKKFSIFCAFCLAASFLGFSAELKVAQFGGEKGWGNLSRQERVQSGVGKFGYKSIELSSEDPKILNDADLLISFENSQIQDEAKNYEIVSNALISTENVAVIGKKAGLSRAQGSGITLRGRDGSLFGTKGFTGSFTFDFWLKPCLTENSEQIFNWSSSKNENNSVICQIIHVSFVRGHVEWLFTNIFSNRNFEENNVSILSHSTIIPDKWAHHVFTYDDESGLIEYCINGKIEAVKFVTDTGHEGGTINHANFGYLAEIEVCPKFTGFVDHFAILRGVHKNVETSLYDANGGRIVTNPIQTAGLGSSAVRLNAVVDLPAQTGVEFFVRGGNNFYEWTDDSPAWKPVRANESISGVEGLFFQVACNLYPDGNGEKTPILSQISLSYSECAPPLPPAQVVAKSGNARVNLQWTQSVDENIGGYLVYYGEKPGEYLGVVAVEGASPIDVGDTRNVVVTGLRNGRIYYFAVATYSSVDKRIIGQLSREVFARPLQSNENF